MYTYTYIRFSMLFQKKIKKSEGQNEVCQVRESWMAEKNVRVVPDIGKSKQKIMPEWH